MFVPDHKNSLVSPKNQEQCAHIHCYHMFRDEEEEDDFDDNGQFQIKKNGRTLLLRCIKTLISKPCILKNLLMTKKLFR